ncbi:hypothetical protein CB0940_01494 [Cercospora beticola]|uniref:Uncharacterized protein n=1 Tax=Cercospora beticola TaxID=122368 RepID=A0A2G5I8R0_CERBT|nr:hypothetical protein CB0940_01494 [Cercospora beticola]PIB00853.1 hypothetical protein CB0940_01494 [Cercospora beticola]WPA96935.1 hypothetical protein RHO25_001543 [Cercospora beticola]
MTLDDSRKASIQHALDQYRQTVFARNMSLLPILVEKIETAVVPDSWNEQNVHKARMRAINDYFAHRLGGDAIGDTISTPQDLLTLMPTSRFAERFKLDGTSHEPVDLTSVTNYFNTLRQALRSKQSSKDPALQDSEYPEEPPEDLEYLMSLVSSISAPKMECDYGSRPSTFFPTESSDLEVHAPVRIGHTLDTPLDEFDPYEQAWEDWTIAVAINIGEKHPDWTPSGVHALYCSPDTEGERKDWKWRYGINEKYYSSELYDSVEEYLLKFWLHFDEETEENVRSAPISLDPEGDMITSWKMNGAEEVVVKPGDPGHHGGEKDEIWIVEPSDPRHSAYRNE